LRDGGRLGLRPVANFPEPVRHDTRPRWHTLARKP
jgi:hypothetical protein